MGPEMLLADNSVPPFKKSRYEKTLESSKQIRLSLTDRPVSSVVKNIMDQSAIAETQQDEKKYKTFAEIKNEQDGYQHENSNYQENSQPKEQYTFEDPYERKKNEKKKWD